MQATAGLCDGMMLQGVLHSIGTREALPCSKIVCLCIHVCNVHNITSYVTMSRLS